MDLFDNSSDDSDVERQTTKNAAFAVVNDSFIELMKMKPNLRKTLMDEVITLYHREICIISDNDTSTERVQLEGKLQKGHFQCIKIINPHDLLARDLSNLQTVNLLEKFDAVIILEQAHDDELLISISKLLRPGTGLITLCCRFDEIFPACEWTVEKSTRKQTKAPILNSSDESCEFVCIRKRDVRVNPLGALYWTKPDAESLLRENILIADLTVSLSAAEKRDGSFRFDSLS
jgi:hypothetical protein